MKKTTTYKPSNGTEGMVFETRFCDRCKKGGGDCLIFANALIYEITEDEYPAEWIMDEGDYQSARCTAFTERE